MSRPPNITALAAGLTVIALGVLVVINVESKLDLGFAYMAPALIAGLGLVILASGIASRGRRPD
ncbi:MAG: hypothetical protein WB507_04130 [Solirubrobacterales bacterium]